MTAERLRKMIEHADAENAPYMRFDKTWLKDLLAENTRLRAVLMKIEDLTDKGTAVIFPEATLKEIQKIAGDALDDDEVLLHDDNGLRLDGN